ncbi:MAG: hypothetical protein HWD82_02675 [Flavobacteriaceae bacterium]|nr:hypothetical protein [Flavobacteriaceae bacterium]
MSRLYQLNIYKRHLEERYKRLVEKSNNYKFIDESESDDAAFKALKLLDKINQIRFLDRELTI